MAPSCVTFINIKKEQSIQKGLQSQGLQPFFDGLYVFSYITSLPRIRRRQRGRRCRRWMHRGWHRAEHRAGRLRPAGR